MSIRRRSPPLARMPPRVRSPYRPVHPIPSRWLICRLTDWVIGRSLPSALDVGELLGDQTVGDPEQIYATDVAAVPAVSPPLHDPVAGPKDLLFVEPRINVGEDRLPRGADGAPTDTSHPVWGWSGGVE